MISSFIKIKIKNLKQSIVSQKKTTKKTILVTGAGGYVGSILVPMLLKKNFKVIAVDKFFFGKTLPEHRDLRLLKKDTRNISAKYFINVYAVIDLVALSNDPSGNNFPELTWQINYQSRLRTAKISKEMGVKKYILPSTCSVYGNQKKIVTENSKTKPLSIYAKSNLNAEKDIIKLKSKNFVIIVLRQATLFGYSPRMRFDLAVNGMTEGVYKNNILPIMRNGLQYRPLCHVKDTSRLMAKLINQNLKKYNGQIFNVGSKFCTEKIIDIAKIVLKNVNNRAELKWYGNPDNRSYKVSFKKLKKLGFKPRYSINYGVKEMVEYFKNNKIKKNLKTITIEWYKYLDTKKKFLEI